MSDISGTVNGVPYTVTEEVIAEGTERGINVLAEVEAAISSERAVEVFTKPNCPYCVQAKALLEKRGYHYTEISAVDNRETLIERVTTMTGSPPKTVPQIFIAGEHIGGYTDLVEWFAKADAK